MQLLTLVKIIHLIGLIMGMGGAVLLDLSLFRRGVLRPVSAFTLHQVKTLSRVVTAGLVMLWLTGFALIALNLAVKPEYLTNPKLWAKIAIVCILTVNGFVIHARVMPLLKASLGRTMFAGLPRRQIAVLTGLGAVSFTSWTVPFVLGKASELNYVTPVAPILSVYLGALLTVWGGLFVVASSIGAIQRRVLRGIEAIMRPSESWERDFK